MHAFFQRSNIRQGACYHHFDIVLEFLTSKNRQSMNTYVSMDVYRWVQMSGNKKGAKEGRQKRLSGREVRTVVDHMWYESETGDIEADGLRCGRGQGGTEERGVGREKSATLNAKRKLNKN